MLDLPCFSGVVYFPHARLKPPALADGLIRYEKISRLHDDSLRAVNFLLPRQTITSMQQLLSEVHVLPKGV